MLRTLNLMMWQRSAIDKDVITIDSDTSEMLEALGFKNIPGVEIQNSK